MKKIIIILLKELKSFFVNPIGYITLTCFLILNGMIFWFLVRIANSPNAPYGAAMKLFFGQTFFYWLLIFIFVPIITMKTFSEEMKSGTIEIMMTVPISEMQIVVGKFLGVFIYYSVLWIPTLIYPFFLSLYSSLDVGPVVSGYIGTLLIGAFFISIGIFCSSISKSQINSAILSFFILVGLFLLGYLKMVAFNSKLLEVFEYINFSEIIKTYSEGIITTKSLVFLVTSSILCLFINIKFLETRKWL